MSLSGEIHAWQRLARMVPEDVCRRAGVKYNTDNRQYILQILSCEIFVSPGDRTIFSSSDAGQRLLKNYAYFSVLAVLTYLISAQEMPLSGNLVRPASIHGGEIFIKGTHVLPVEKIAKKYARSVDVFKKRCRELGGEPLTHADAAFRLFPFPRVAVAVLLWDGDDEFPARADVLLDASCEKQLPPDIIWSMMMMTGLMLLE
ncbi:DUF3786 domain-containing protein [candidate division KSB1 bacterium]|nr:DUF3786 domain-containing protein [candidate division KSB1 bacterium]